jgi:glycosyltransferase involved in cell wall biosynthesis
MTKMTDWSHTEISVVIPAYNEQANVPTLLNRIAEVFKPLGRKFEVVIVDDGSSDDTLKVLAEQKRSRPWLRVISLDRHCGQTCAMTAGFRAARGDVIATLDADLQNDPAEIPRLLSMLNECDAVTGWRVKRQDPLLRRISTRIANGVRNKLSGESIHDSACSLKVYKRACLDGLTLYEGLHRFMPTLVKMRGFKVIEVPVSHHARRAGQTKYGMWNRMFRAFIDLLVVRWMKKRYLRYQAREL